MTTLLLFVLLITNIYCVWWKNTGLLLSFISVCVLWYLCWIRNFNYNRILKVSLSRKIVNICSWFWRSVAVLSWLHRNSCNVRPKYFILILFQPGLPGFKPQKIKYAHTPRGTSHARSHPWNTRVGFLPSQTLYNHRLTRFALQPE